MSFMILLASIIAMTSVDPETLSEQRKVLGQKDIQHEKIELFSDYEKVEDQNSQAPLAKMGCLLVAGGQGTRLKFDGPKGMFPVSVIKNKSLFQLVAEKTLAASKKAGTDLQLAIMTSSLNDKQTRAFFKENQNFGLKESQLSFFVQGELPFLDEQGQIMHDASSNIAVGPDGNGNTLHTFVRSGIWKKWKEQGIDYINFVLIDNPLADPFDEQLLAYHIKMNDDVTLKCVARENPQEKVGLLVLNDGKPGVIEYSELTDAERAMPHPCVNISLFCFNMDFAAKIAQEKLPLHKAYKPIYAGGPQGWKFEYFIFDVLPLAHHVHALIYPRAQTFAPLKNASGPDSIETVQAALQNRDIAIWKQNVGTDLPSTPFELSADFYYPSTNLKGKQAPDTSYITLETL